MLIVSKSLAALTSEKRQPEVNSFLVFCEQIRKTLKGRKLIRQAPAISVSLARERQQQNNA